MGARRPYYLMKMMYEGFLQHLETKSSSSPVWLFWACPGPKATLMSFIMSVCVLSQSNKISNSFIKKSTCQASVYLSQSFHYELSLINISSDKFFGT